MPGGKDPVRRARLPAIGAALLLLIAASPAASLAAPGDLDPTFGSGGKVLTDFFQYLDKPVRVAVLPDGKIVAAGSTSPAGRPVDNDIAVSRYLPDGQLDPTFDVDGRALYRNFGVDTEMTVRDAAMEPGGAVVVAGDFVGGVTRAMAVRFLPNGKADTFFGDGGRFIAGINGSAMAVALQADGKVVLAGDVGLSGFGGLTLLRLHPTGVLDDTFGLNGVAAIEHHSGRAGKMIPYAAIVQEDGKILLVGSTLVQLSPDLEAFSLARLTPEGALDQGFGSGGWVSTVVGSTTHSASALGVAIQRDRKIVVAGSDNRNIILARYTPEGALDDGFGQGGEVVTHLPVFASVARGVAIQKDCKIVIAGIEKPSLTTSHFILARYLPDGSIDEAFGDEGIVRTRFADPGQNEFAAAVALQQDGKIVAAGAAPAAGNLDFTLARYESKAGTPAGLIDDLAGLVRCIQLPEGIENSLLVKLEGARSAVAEGEGRRACGYLAALENQLGAQSGKRFITASDATDLLSAVREIAADLGCSG